jgi:hypothetical protein
MSEYIGLCHRCEHRAKYLEDYERAKQKLIEQGRRDEIPNLFVHRPRCECGLDQAVHSCYMYQPVKPLVIEKKRRRRTASACSSDDIRTVPCGTVTRGYPGSTCNDRRRAAAVLDTGGTEMTALEKQVGGEHYKQYRIQPAVFCQENRIPWCEANIIKYVCRHRTKGGAADIDKAIHYLELIKQMEYEPCECEEEKPRPLSWE